MSSHTKPETPAGRPLGDTGDGRTGVPDDEQGISNRPGDHAQGKHDEAADDEGNAPKSGPTTTSKD